MNDNDRFDRLDDGLSKIGAMLQFLQEDNKKLLDAQISIMQVLTGVSENAQSQEPTAAPETPHDVFLGRKRFFLAEIPAKLEDLPRGTANEISHTCLSALLIQLRSIADTYALGTFLDALSSNQRELTEDQRYVASYLSNLATRFLAHICSNEDENFLGYPTVSKLLTFQKNFLKFIEETRSTGQKLSMIESQVNTFVAQLGDVIEFEKNF